MAEGLCGWQVQDLVVTLTHAGMVPTSTAADYRHLTPLVLMDALKMAGTTVLEPIQRFTLEIPVETLGDVFTALVAHRVLPQQTETLGPVALIVGTIPTAEIRSLEQRLPGLSAGDGVFTAEFDHYTDIIGTPPARPRTDLNPLDRKEYLARVSQG